MKITDAQKKDGEELFILLNDTLEIIFGHIGELVNSNRHNFARSYIEGLAIDMLGKTLTFPGINKQDEMDYLSKWIKHRYGVSLRMVINNEN